MVKRKHFDDATVRHVIRLYLRKTSWAEITKRTGVSDFPARGMAEGRQRYVRRIWEEEMKIWEDAQKAERAKNEGTSSEEEFGPSSRKVPDALAARPCKESTGRRLTDYYPIKSDGIKSEKAERRASTASSERVPSHAEHPSLNIVPGPTGEAPFKRARSGNQGPPRVLRVRDDNTSLPKTSPCPSPKTSHRFSPYDPNGPDPSRPRPSSSGKGEVEMPGDPVEEKPSVIHSFLLEVNPKLVGLADEFIEGGCSDLEELGELAGLSLQVLQNSFLDKIQGATNVQKGAIAEKLQDWKRKGRFGR